MGESQTCRIDEKVEVFSKPALVPAPLRLLVSTDSGSRLILRSRYTSGFTLVVILRHSRLISRCEASCTVRVDCCYCNRGQVGWECTSLSEVYYSWEDGRDKYHEYLER